MKKLILLITAIPLICAAAPQHVEQQAANLKTILRQADDAYYNKHESIMGNAAYDALRDQYDRLLAYVVRSSDELFINLDLLEQGFAGVLIYEPNSYYRDLFEAAEDAAFADDRGLWGVCGGPDVPLE